MALLPTSFNFSKAVLHRAYPPTLCSAPDVGIRSREWVAMRIQRTALTKILALGLPLLLAGCGGEAAPVDPCKTLETETKGKDLSDARDRAYQLIDRRKKAISKEFEATIKYEKPTVNCARPENPPADATKATNANSNTDLWAKKKSVKPQMATCKIVMRYCAQK